MVILPTQNPDGREADTRRNAYGFDMNRDWFARTQPETDGKLEMLRELPPQVFVDAHEMGRATYFFPPNADPVYHEIGETPLDWIYNRLRRRDAGGVRPLHASRTSTATSTTSSTWATATVCRPPASTRRA